jgi:hypothetical protein
MRVLTCVVVAYGRCTGLLTTTAGAAAPTCPTACSGSVSVTTRQRSHTHSRRPGKQCNPITMLHIDGSHYRMLSERVHNCPLADHEVITGAWNDSAFVCVGGCQVRGLSGVPDLEALLALDEHNDQRNDQQKQQDREVRGGTK